MADGNWKPHNLVHLQSLVPHAPFGHALPLGRGIYCLLPHWDRGQGGREGPAPSLLREIS